MYLVLNPAGGVTPLSRPHTLVAAGLRYWDYKVTVLMAGRESGRCGAAHVAPLG